MRLFALIGILILLFAPFMFTRVSLETPVGDTSANTFYGFFWFYTSGEGESNTETFDMDWTEEGNFYEFLFGEDFRLVGLVILVVLLIGLAFAVIDTDDKRSTYILLICGVALFVLRFLKLNDNDRFFYDSEETLFGKFTYLEIPIGFILSLIFGLIDRGKSY